jgi:hypothetical protein
MTKNLTYKEPILIYSSPEFCAYLEGGVELGHGRLEVSIVEASRALSGGVCLARRRGSENKGRYY